MPYEVIIHDAGPGANQIMSYVQSYTGCTPEEALKLLENLPLVIKQTNSKMEAYLIKEAVKSFGGTVEIVQIDEDGYSTSNYSSSKYEDDIDLQHSMGPIQMWPEHHRDNGGHEGPIKTGSGCLSVIIGGFLLFVSSVCIASIIIN